MAELTTEPQRSLLNVGSCRRTARRSWRRGSRRRRQGTRAADLDAISQPRFDALRDLRNDLRDGKPAYVVFDNKTLVSIARMAPTTLQDLGRISGVGPAKLEKYGEQVIGLMQKLTAG